MSGARRPSLALLASRPSVKELRVRFEAKQQPAQTPAQFEAKLKSSGSAPASRAKQVASHHNLLVQASILSERRKSAVAIPNKDDVEMMELETWLQEEEPAWIGELLKEGEDGANEAFEFLDFSKESEAVTNESVLRFFFENHDPKRVPEVADLLAGNKGREEALFIELSSQYPEPSTAFAFLVVQQEQGLLSKAHAESNPGGGEGNLDTKRRPSFITGGIRRQSGWQVSLGEAQTLNVAEGGIVGEHTL